jgi:uncharacterized protein YecT (DUF1311 family)
MSRSLLLSLLLACAVAAPWAATADEPAAKDIAAIGDCLRRPAGKPATQESETAACLMIVARPCMGREDAAPDRRRIECLDRERGAWERLVAQAEQTMMAGLEREQQAKLREMQQAWSRSRDLSCGFWYDYFEGTMAHPMIAACTNRETARRAIFLRIFAADMAQRK